MINLRIIKTLCREKGITLKKLSKDIKVSQTALTMAMNRNSTTLETLEKIAHYFGLSVGFFFGEEDGIAPLRKVFDDFNENLKLTSNFITTTMQFYMPELEYPFNPKIFFGADNIISPEVVKIIDFSFNKIADNPVCSILKNFSTDDLLKLYSNGIITREIACFIVVIKQENTVAQFFDNDDYFSFWQTIFEEIEKFLKKSGE